MKLIRCMPLLALAIAAGCADGEAEDAPAARTASAPAAEAGAPTAAAAAPGDSGSFTAQVTGTPSGSWRGTASFTPSYNTAGQPLIVITMSSPAGGDGQHQVKLFHVGALPGPGEYAITGQERELRGELSWPGGGLPSSVSQPGRLTITTSDSASVPRRLAGTFQFTGADPTGKPQATVSGEFSASCTMAYRAC